MLRGIDIAARYSCCAREEWPVGRRLIKWDAMPTNSREVWYTSRRSWSKDLVALPFPGTGTGSGTGSEGRWCVIFLSHAKSKRQKAEAKEQQSERFAGELEETSCIHFKGLRHFSLLSLPISGVLKTQVEWSGIPNCCWPSANASYRHLRAAHCLLLRMRPDPLPQPPAGSEFRIPNFQRLPREG